LEGDGWLVNEVSGVSASTSAVLLRGPGTTAEVIEDSVRGKDSCKISSSSLGFGGPQSVLQDSASMAERNRVR
jgi:hypothetical protein